MGYFLIIVLLTLAFPRSVYAYLDPGTGSYVFQVILATILGGAVGLKSYWSKIKKIFTKKKLHEKQKTKKSTK